MKTHLAIFTKEYLNRILTGQKTVETRFSQKKIPPFGQVQVGDYVYMKLSGEDIKGRFKVKKVIYFENLDPKDWDLIETHYLGVTSSGDKSTDIQFLSKKETAKYGTLIFIGNVEQFITPPITIPKKDLRSWVVLS